MRGNAQRAFLLRAALDSPSILQQTKMVKAGVRFFVLQGMALALFSCAAPKATVVAEAPVKKKEQKAPEPVVAEPEMPPLPNDEIRLPSQMLDLPDDGAFRASNPQLPQTGSGSGAVIVRPPTDPPSRVKPKDEGAE